ncbi:MAG: Uma2 family endonuclease [Acidimicrobiales bacterium]
MDSPSDGHRYEVIDGALVVSPAPRWPHQRAVFRLARLLDQAAPDGVEVFTAPLAWPIREGEVPEPDVMVIERSSLGPEQVEGTPLLVIEVLSPTGRRRDLLTKRYLYASAGCPSYWIVDPDEPSLTVLGLEGHRYRQLAQVVGNEAFEATDPFAVIVRPADLTVDS